MSQLINVPVNKIMAHPNNPRKDLGDLNELADSIKAQGILQNLTVVSRGPQGYCNCCAHYNGGIGKCQDGYDDGMKPPCDKWESDDKYTVVIGHRRLAAAKIAGLTEVPCTIADMDRKAQISTMLLENMQRNDLTIYEQAQGFQMMLNLGDQLEDISKSTGLSASTVRRRLKLLELDQDKFKAADARGASLSDYMELDKIKSTELKNSVLEKVGTANFQYALKNAIDDETREERVAKWVKVLSAFATQVDSNTGYRIVKYLYSSGEPICERPDDADSRDYYFIINQYGSINLLVKDDGQGAQPKESAEEAKKRERLEYRRSELTRVTKLAYDLRKAFVCGVSGTIAKKHLSDIVSYSLMQKIDGYSSLDEDDILNMLGIALNEDDNEELTYEMLFGAVATSPERAILLSIAIFKITGNNQTRRTSPGNHQE